MSLYDFLPEAVIQHVIIGYLDTRTMFEIYKVDHVEAIVREIAQRTLKRFARNIVRIRDKEVRGEMWEQKKPLKVISLNDDKIIYHMIKEYRPTLEPYIELLKAIAKIPREMGRLIVETDFNWNIWGYNGIRRETEYRRYDMYCLIFSHTSVKRSAKSQVYAPFNEEEIKSAAAERERKKAARAEYLRGIHETEKEIMQLVRKVDDKIEREHKKAISVEEQARVNENCRIIRKYRDVLDKRILKIIEDCIAAKKRFELTENQGNVRLAIFPEQGPEY